MNHARRQRREAPCERHKRIWTMAFRTTQTAPATTFVHSRTSRRGPRRDSIPETPIVLGFFNPHLRFPPSGYRPAAGRALMRALAGTPSLARILVGYVAMVLAPIRGPAQPRPDTSPVWVSPIGEHDPLSSAAQIPRRTCTRLSHSAAWTIPARSGSGSSAVRTRARAPQTRPRPCRKRNSTDRYGLIPEWPLSGTLGRALDSVRA